MIRQPMLRAAVRASSSFQPARLAAVRFASTHVPTNASGPPPAEISTKLAPGEEIDPQLNGYPQLPYIHFAQKPALGWWDNQSRTNFGETVHEEADMLNVWAPDLHKHSGPRAAAGILFMLSLMGAFAYGLSYTVPEIPVVRREYPFNGLEKELGGVPTRAESQEDEE
ncbi:hypothetical protein DB88DRAFT_489608 [Papiliotrema laurentii]|uniref:Uncharacterized protein n=1 Tax=Papiliotrema laurentii TaxID=5418 RepID=A0AAD9CY66_PAPLA|nr:hypothetical protein DB88DRAFT_489608 [Papiliotrema laurentii]